MTSSLTKWGNWENRRLGGWGAPWEDEDRDRGDALTCQAGPTITRQPAPEAGRKDALSRPQKEPTPLTPWSVDHQPPELLDGARLVFEALSLWSFVKAATGNSGCLWVFESLEDQRGMF